MSWDHGYFSSSSYTTGVYRELAPSWLDFAALLNGHQPQRAPVTARKDDAAAVD